MMIERERLTAGVNLVAWGYIFLLLNVDINGFSLIPNFVGYLLLFLAIRRLNALRPELNRLGLPCLLLFAYELLKWPGYLAQFDNHLWVFLTVFLVSFFFQAYFLTALVELAADYLPGRSIVAELTSCRKWYLGCMADSGTSPYFSHIALSCQSDWIRTRFAAYRLVFGECWREYLAGGGFVPVA